jgi:4-aminobutyrate aminotransferase
VALRACRLASGKRKVVAFAHGYHGGIGLAMEVSAYIGR